MKNHFIPGTWMIDEGEKGLSLLKLQSTDKIIQHPFILWSKMIFFLQICSPFDKETLKKVSYNIYICQI